MLLFEEGKSLDIHNNITNEGICGVKRLLAYLKMLTPNHLIEPSVLPSIYINKSVWLRAKCSGLLHNYNTIGKFERKVKTPHNIYIINGSILRLYI